jgi:hypothetical protein
MLPSVVSLLFPVFRQPRRFAVLFPQEMSIDRLKQTQCSAANNANPTEWMVDSGVKIINLFGNYIRPVPLTLC